MNDTRLRGIRFLIMTCVMICAFILPSQASTTQTTAHWNGREIQLLSLHPHNRSIADAQRIEDQIIIFQLDRPCTASSSAPERLTDAATHRILTVRHFKCLNEDTPFVIADPGFDDLHTRRYLSIGLQGARSTSSSILNQAYHSARVSHLGGGVIAINGFAMETAIARMSQILPEILTSGILFASLAVAMLATSGASAPSLLFPFLIGLSLAFAATPMLSQPRTDIIFVIIGLLIMGRASFDILSRTHHWALIALMTALLLLIGAAGGLLGHGIFMLAVLSGVALFSICLALRAHFTSNLDHLNYIFMLGLMNGLWLAQSRYDEPVPQGQFLATVSGEIIAAGLGCAIITLVLRVGHSLFDVMQPARTNIYRDATAGLFVAFGSFICVSHFMRLL